MRLGVALGFLGLVAFLALNRLGAFVHALLGGAILAAVAATATATLAALTATIGAFAAVFGFGFLGLFLDLVLKVLLGQVLEVFLQHQRLELGHEFVARTRRDDAHLGAFILAFGDHFDRDAIAMLDLAQVNALGIEQVDRGFLAGEQGDDRTLALGRLFLDQAQRRQARRPGGTHQTRAVAMRARTGGGLQHARAQALAAHFHQAEGRNAAHLDARAVVLQRLLHGLLDLADVRAIFHVDEVDDDQTGHVAQAQLAGDLARGLKVGGNGGLLDAMLLGGTARVDVDRDQCFGRVDDDIAARLQLNHRIIHRGQLILGAKALEQGNRIGIMLHPARMAGHQQLHEITRRAIAIVALDDHFLDIAVIDVADRALDKVAVRMDQRGRGGFQRVLADIVPQAGQIVEVALDFGLGALKARRAHDAAHALGQVHFGDDGLQPLAVGKAADLARNPAAMAGIGHQHAIAARQAEIGGESRTLVAALFLHDLNQQHLTTMDHVLNLVAAAQSHTLGAQFFGFLGVGGIAPALTAPATAATLAAFFAFRCFFGFMIAVEAVFDMTGLDRGHAALFRRVHLDQRTGVLDAAAREIVGQTFAQIVVADEIFLTLGHRAQGGFFLGMGGLFGQQCLAVFLGDLVIIGVDFGKGEEAVAVAPEIDKSGLKRRLDARHLGQIDITLDLLVIGRIKVEFFNTVALEHRHPGFFRVARIDQHAR